jgi:peptidyl-prolyl cis-trans isomerase A (cyclophilin A)
MTPILRALQVLVLIVVGAAALADDDIVRAQLVTDLGVIEIEVDSRSAPVTAENFLRLVDGGHLDGGSFYRAVSPRTDNGHPVISVIQGGIGRAPKPFQPIAHETTEQTGLLHVDGAISMARGAVGTASTEFFICIGDQPALDFGAERNADGQGFAVFGRVVTGMDVVRAIHQRPSDAPTESTYVAGQILEQPVIFESVKRVAAPEAGSGATPDTRL